MGEIAEEHEERFGMICDMCGEPMPDCDCELDEFYEALEAVKKGEDDGQEKAT